MSVLELWLHRVMPCLPARLGPRQFVATVGGSQVCYYNPCEFLSVATSSSIHYGWTSATDSVHQASEVENYGYVGYMYSSQFYAVTQEVYAGIPGN